jgi:hypothetical protein
MLGDDKPEPHWNPPMLKGEFSTILVFNIFFGFFYVLQSSKSYTNQVLYGWLIIIFVEGFHVVERFVGIMSKLKACVFIFTTTNNTSRRNPNYWQHYKELEYLHGIFFHQILTIEIVHETLELLCVQWTLCMWIMNFVMWSNLVR